MSFSNKLNNLLIMSVITIMTEIQFEALKNHFGIDLRFVAEIVDTVSIK